MTISRRAGAFQSIVLSAQRRGIQALAGGAADARAVFYLHGEGGLTADDPFLLMLAKEHRVIAPFLPGFEDGLSAPESHDDPRDMLDFTLFGLEALQAARLPDPILIGHSMGGMIAAEMAAISPDSVSHLNLIAPLGLWLDDYPVADLFAAMPHELPRLLFYDFDDAGPKNMQRAMSRTGVVGGGLDQGANDPDVFVQNLVRNARQMGAAGKLLFPIPDRGLSRRLYRIRASTSVIWGEADRMAPSIYGRAFADGIAAARLTIVPKAGHMAHWEQPQSVIRAITGQDR